MWFYSHLYLQWPCMAFGYVLRNVCEIAFGDAWDVHLRFSLCVVIFIWCVFMILAMFMVLLAFLWLCMTFGMCAKFYLTMLRISMFLWYSLCMVIIIWCVFIILAIFVVLLAFVWLCIYNYCVWHLVMYVLWNACKISFGNV